MSRTNNQNEYLELEIKHMQSSLNKINGCKHWVISRVFKEINEKHLNQQNIAQKSDEDDENVYSLFLPYNSLKGEYVINTVRKQLNIELPEKVKIQTYYNGRR